MVKEKTLFIANKELICVALKALGAEVAECQDAPTPPALPCGIWYTGLPSARL